MVQGSMTCVKYLLFIFNFIFVICGLILIIIGALNTTKDMTEFMDSKYVTAPIILICVGCFIFVVAFLGCCGAIREHHCMIMTFGLLVFLIFIVEIAGGISAYMYRSHVEIFLRENMNTSLAQQREESVKIWDEMQIRLECCGVDGAGDYSMRKIKIPPSCCKDLADPCTESSAYPKGCYPQMLHKIKGAIVIVGGIAVGLAVVELVGCMFAWCLASAIKRDYENS